MFRVPSLSIFLAITLAPPAPATAQDAALQAKAPPSAGASSYPEAAIDRPGILPHGELLMTTDVVGTRSGGEVGQSLALGLGDRVELTLDARRSLSPDQGTESLAPGLGVRTLLTGPVEIDARLTVPLFLSGPIFRGFTLGSASSYTFGSGFVLSAFSELLVIETEPNTHWMLPVDLGIGFQATRKLFLELGTYAVTYDGSERAARTLLDEAPLSLSALWSINPAWDVGVALAVDDAHQAQDTWSAGLYVTWKAVRRSHGTCQLRPSILALESCAGWRCRSSGCA